MKKALIATLIVLASFIPASRADAWTIQLHPMPAWQRYLTCVVHWNGVLWYKYPFWYCSGSSF